MNKDIIFIRALKVNAIIGIFDWERENTQPLIFDIEMETDIQKSASSDLIDDTVCYKTVADEIINLAKQSQFELIESLAEVACSMVLNNHKGVSGLTLSINKPQAVEQAKTVGLTIFRSQEN